MEKISFIRELEIESISKSLRLHQQIEGHVSCVVWDVAIVLAKYLETLCQKRPGFLEDKNVVELGAGVGCVGITAACLGHDESSIVAENTTESSTSAAVRANVLLTDLPVAMPLLSHNVETNRVKWKQSQGNAETMPLIWGQEIDQKFTPDIILLADCIYYKESVDPLLKTLKELAADDTTVLLSQELRDSAQQRECWEYFIEQGKEYFDFHFVPRKEQHPDFSSSDIALIKLIRS